MHLVIVTCELATSKYPSGGLASFTANLARIFKRNGHKVTIVLSLTKDETITFDKEITIKKTYVDKKLWNRFNAESAIIAEITGENRDEIRKFMVNLYKSEQIKSAIDEIKAEEKIDIIHACHLSSLSVRFGDDVPYVVRLSSYMNIWNGAELLCGSVNFAENPLSINNKLEIYNLKKSKYIVSPSNLLAETGREYIGIDPVVIESPFVLYKDDWDYSVYDVLARGKKYIIHYGRLGYLKGTHIIAHIAKRILEKYSDFTILLVGNSTEMVDEKGNSVLAHKLVQAEAEEYSDRVIYAGVLVREQLYPLIQNAQLCLLPSRIENLSNACIEAMAMGKVVVATNGASYEQLIDDKVSGYLCERDNPESFLQAVEEVLSMDLDAKRQMELAAARQVERLAPDVIYQKYNEYYQKVIHEWKIAKKENDGKSC